MTQQAHHSVEANRDLSADSSPRSLEDRYHVEDGRIYLSGVQALVRLPIDIRRSDDRAGLDTAVFISGYEGSPLAGYDLELIRRKKLLDEHSVVHQPGLNEELAANAVWGSQMAPTLQTATKEGVVGIWYGKAPGLDRATDAIRHGVLGGTHPCGGVLALVGDDAIAKSSTVPSSSETAMAEMGMTVLAPSDPQDILDLGLHGVAMSRFCGLWTGMKIATNVADGSASAVVGPDRVKVVLPDDSIDGVPFTHEPTMRMLPPHVNQLEQTMMVERLELARRYCAANGLNRRSGAAGAKIGIVTAGIAYLDVMEALGNLGLGEEELGRHGIGVLKLGMVAPLVPEEIDDFARGLDEIIVVEEKRPLIERQLKDLLFNTESAPVVVGKTDENRQPLLRAHHELGADLITEVLARRFSKRTSIPSVDAWLAARLSPAVAAPAARRQLPLVTRTPYFCSGCPHNRSTVVPAGSTVGAGIGCHAMTMFLDEDRVGDILGTCQMGGEGAPWVGIEPFVADKHLFQNIGDGTFHHSGSLALRFAVAAGVNVTYKILYNSAVAMTGGQETVGGMSVPDLAANLLSEGVKRVVVTTEEPERYDGVRLPKGVELRHRDRLLETQEELAAVKGVTVLIHDQECATELRRKRKRGLVQEPETRVFINQRVCEGCGDCGEKSNCLSVQPVETEFGRKTKIHQPSCNKDYSCLDGDCPSFLTVIPGVKAKQPTGKVAPPIDSSILPDPEIKVPEEEFSIRFTGIGGTGIVTVSAIVAQAGIIAGRYVRTLDQLGLAQKGGAVVSDIKIGARPIEAANKISAGDCDLFLVCDLLVGSTDANLAVTSSQRTVAVINKAHTPTGAMVTHTDVLFPPDDATVGRINDATRAEHNTVVDARLATLGLFGDDQYANVFLVGVAHQAGALPIPADAIEEAITLNGVRVDHNIQAFRRGRQLVADRASVNAAVDALRLDHLRESDAALAPSNMGVALARGLRGPDSELRRLVTLRAGELAAYQNRRYAERYVDLVEKVRAREQTVAPDSTALAEAVAKHLFKLMAYKDEYEVARLSLDPKLRADIKATFGEDASYSFKLHPPMLRALGMSSKIALPQAVGEASFKALYRMRRLRGTALDPFGKAEVRRVERELIDKYRREIIALLESLTRANLPVAVEIANLPDMIRGYEDIKLRNVEAYRDRLATLKTNYARTDPPDSGTKRSLSDRFVPKSG
ncbi:indolepyruvate ferredoxin oxidoreductase family protein [Blastococcus sp. Marseille-P5729]|uniref:indolepyruvate ferredoxin oxidoreductase family protein n=1 Tax=Blastococcus sp. Marseille-P5729 TaxID=2086582 RepID=UPI000D0F25E8|nr:indolepyruvate ferredoxin oxidoreductase family protein [Blastococcus sp. Marseille-P5729]